MSITEDELKERATAPRVTLEEVHSCIHAENYFTARQGAYGAACWRAADHTVVCDVAYSSPAPLDILTFCVLTLKNGFTVTGQSACADPANYQADIGQRIAKQDAVNKIWPLLGYELKTKLALIDAAAEPSFPNMGTFVGTKVIHAYKMDRLEYCNLRGWKVPSDENPLDDGYLVEYTDGGKPNVIGFNGYVSWSPKGVFEAAYKEVGQTPAPKAEVPTSTWLDQAKVELVELEDRVIKLVAFLASPSITTIDPREWTALREQRKGMEAYLCQLRGRVARASL